MSLSAVGRNPADLRVLINDPAEKGPAVHLNHVSHRFVTGWLNSAHPLPILHFLTVQVEGFA